MKYAVALEGGGTRGAFEVGVWKAIKELKLNIGAVAGTSIGAINGAMFASDSDAISLWSNISVNDILDIDNAKGLHAVISYVKEFSKGGIDNTPLRRFLEKHLSEQALRDSEIDFGLSTFSLESKREVNLFKEDIPEGKMIDYILASADFPLFKPSFIDGKKYIDGGVRNNLPVNMLVNRGYKSIITVSIKGVGLRHDADTCGVNIIEINAPTAESGILDFDKTGIHRAIDSGYCQCMKAFGKLQGDRYAITPDSYEKAVEIHGKALIKNIEKAAEMINIYPYKVYTANQLATEVVKHYKENKALDTFVSFIMKKEHNIIHSKLDSIPGIYDAANAIAYIQNLT